MKPMNEKKIPALVRKQAQAYARWLNASPKHAFLTAALTTLVHSEASFVEGWVCMEVEGDLLIWEHAWCHTPSGILDPTLALLHDACPPLSYYPGASYDQDTLWQRWQEGASFPFTRLSTGEGTVVPHPASAAAFAAASAQARIWRAAQTDRSIPPAVCILVAHDQQSDPAAQEEGQAVFTSLSAWQETIPLSERAGLHVDVSLRLARLVRARAGACYQNSAIGTCLQTRRAGQTTTYVEGWLLCETEHALEIVEHAWCESEGWIIEPTLPFLIQDGTELLSFFAGARLSCALMEATLMRYGLPWVKLCGLFGEDGLGNQGYRYAFEQALTAAVARKRETNKPILLARSSRRGEDAVMYQITVDAEPPTVS